MSRNHLFLLCACAIALGVMSTEPAPFAHSAPITLASLMHAGSFSASFPSVTH